MRWRGEYTEGPVWEGKKDVEMLGIYFFIQRGEYTEGAVWEGKKGVVARETN
jgi:hypothetical protein